MGLVGMTHKPLHVRRLQKALIEWRANRGADLPSGLRRTSDSPANGHAPACRTDHQFTSKTSAAREGSWPFDSSDVSVGTATVHAGRRPAALDVACQQQTDPPRYQCLQPREVFVGAPKRPRLMDNLHRKSTNRLDTSARSEQLETSFSSVCERQVAPNSKRSQRKCTSDSEEESEERLIEVLDSSQSDFEPDDNATGAVCGSPDAPNRAPNKSQRNKASLLCRSPRKPGPED